MTHWGSSELPEVPDNKEYPSKSMMHPELFNIMRFTLHVPTLAH
jgi:hypothetical protein